MEERVVNAGSNWREREEAALYFRSGIDNSIENHHHTYLLSITRIAR